jgi:hypothetical protein
MKGKAKENSGVEDGSLLSVSVKSNIRTDTALAVRHEIQQHLNFRPVKPFPRLCQGFHLAVVGTKQHVIRLLQLQTDVGRDARTPQSDHIQAANPIVSACDAIRLIPAPPCINASVPMRTN